VNEIKPINQAPNWHPIAIRIVVDITRLFSEYSSLHEDVLDTDFCKLLNLANKLEQFCGNYKTIYRGDSDKLWHDLRNLIGSIQGYSELLQDDIDESHYPGIPEQLQGICTNCNQFFQQESDTGKYSRSPKIRPTGEPGTILIVDDQAESREILARYLLQDKHRVVEAASGVIMFDRLSSEEVDLILLDLILPEMDGFQLLQRLKQHNIWRAIPVIVVSGMKDTERVISCIEAGAEDYLFKPFNPVLLQARISAGVERKRWHDREEKYRKELELNQRFIRKVFGRYVSEEIVDALLENPDGLDLGGVQRKVTVLMADIRGFTTICEQLPPHRVVRLLNNYLGGMADIIMKYSGTVDEFIGDAILAIFGAPVRRHDDSDRAICCALEMQQALEGINQRNKLEDLPQIEIGISLNTGLVVAGNIGSEKRTKYGVVGHTVNQTARIEEQCPAGSIYISEATLNDSQSLLSIGLGKTIQAKGILQAITVYELTNLSPAALSSLRADNVTKLL
jgi:adenylate cyclase